MSKDRRLGRGLAALLGNVNELESAEETGASGLGDEYVVERGPLSHAAAAADPATSWLQLNVYEIDDNPFQPRRDFSQAEIVSLAESLKEHDMLQPILVRRVGDRYQLISGERRLRAAIHAGWSTIPARVRDADDRLVAELAIVENLQRKDLNPIEKALSFRRYLDQHQCSQEELAGRLKIDRSTIANLLRLLELPEPVMHAVQDGRLSAGHARALLPLGDDRLQRSFADQILTDGWSVRETERQVQARIDSDDQEPLRVVGLEQRPRKSRPRSQQVAALEQELRHALGTKVEIRQNATGRGKILIHFTSHDEFDRLRAALTDTSPSAQSATG